jgi:hypothetical protein
VGEQMTAPDDCTCAVCELRDATRDFADALARLTAAIERAAGQRVLPSPSTSRRLQ